MAFIQLLLYIFLEWYEEWYLFFAALSGKLTKKLVENLGAGRHGDGVGFYLVVDPSGALRYIVRVTFKGQKNRKGAPLRTDFDLGGADIVTLN